MKSVNLNFLERPGPLQACNGTALPVIYQYQYQYMATKMNGAALYTFLLSQPQNTLLNLSFLV